MLGALKTLAQFKYIQGQGIKLHGNYLLIIAARLNQEQQPQNIQDSHIPLDHEKQNTVKQLLLGLKVSKKFAKSAVQRNKARRQIRHLVRIMWKTNLLPKTSTGIIVIPKHQFKEACFQQLLKDFTSISKKLTEKLILSDKSYN